MSDKIRKEFEAFYLTEYDELTLYGNSVFERRETFCGDDIVDSCEYANEEVQFAWEWWVKSRAALVVELPRKIGEGNAKIRQDRNKTIDKCRDAIHAAGLSTK